jgi:hypothetical protein
VNIHAIDETGDMQAEGLPVLAIRLGRGRTGGTTFLDFLIQRARRLGREVRIADGDPNNATLSEYYPPSEPGGAIRPRAGDVGDVAEWVTEVTSSMAMDRCSMVLDMGGGDRVLEAHGKDMDLRAFCEASEIAPLAIYSIGPEAADFDHAMTIFDKGYFRSERAIVVMNESLVQGGKTAGGAFDFVFADDRYGKIGHTVRPVMMPKLACMQAMRQERLTFHDAAEGKSGRSGRPMSLGHQFIVKTWINRMEKNLSAVAEWLP